MTTSPGSRRALGPGVAGALGGPAPAGRRTPPWTRPVLQQPAPAAPDPASAPDPAPAPAAQAVDAIAARRIVRVPAAVLESALHLAQALLQRPGEDPLLLEAAEGLAAVIPQHLASARQQIPPRPAPPARLRPAPEPTVQGTGRLLA